MPISLSICFCLSVCSSVRLPVRLSVCACPSVCLSVCLSVCSLFASAVSQSATCPMCLFSLGHRSHLHRAKVSSARRSVSGVYPCIHMPASRRRGGRSQSRHRSWRSFAQRSAAIAASPLLERWSNSGTRISSILIGRTRISGPDEYP